ncbi:hypothetical protein Taro_002101, partial [Colocasia esculenta]|nr:hypothetical protein [Colocasia esculenta]
MWFSPKPEYFCYFSNGRGISVNFPTTGTFMQFLHLSGVFLQFSRQQRELLAILHPPRTFLQFPTLQGRFYTFPHKLGYFCNFLLFKGFSAISYKLGASMQVLRATGVLLQFFLTFLGFGPTTNSTMHIALSHWLLLPAHFSTQEFPKEDLRERTSLQRSDMDPLHQVNST